MSEILRENCTNTGKYGPEKTAYVGTFQAVKYISSWIVIFIL